MGTHGAIGNARKEQGGMVRWHRWGLGLLGILSIGVLIWIGGASGSGARAAGIAPAGPPLTPCPRAWQVVPSPNVGTGPNFLTGVAAIADDDIWAVGYY